MMQNGAGRRIGTGFVWGPERSVNHESFLFEHHVHTSFPEAKSSITVLGSGILWIRPGNCSGSYIDFGSCLAASSRWTFPPRFAEATMFWMTISASFLMGMPPFFSLLTTSCTAFLDWSSDFPPVQTILPELKIKVAVFGFLSLKTSPGNWSG